jgi:flagellar hook protein FlgE
MSFYTALTGLNGSQADIAATSNNIANVGTTGFKRSRAEFGDIFATSPLQNSSSSIGSGSILKGVKQQFTQGNIAASLNALDLAISGQGFFALKPSLTSSQVVYTRNGSFNVDNNRNVVDSTGQFLLTYPVNEDGSVTSKTINEAVPLQLPVTSGEPKATSTIDLAVNLPADAPVVTDHPKFEAGYSFNLNDPDSFTNSTSLTIFDDLGNPTIATVYFIKTQNAGAEDPTNKYDTRLVIDGTVIDPDLVAAVNDNGDQLFVDRFGRETTVAGIPDDNYFSEGKGSALYRKDELNEVIPSQPSRLTGSQSSFDFGEEGNKLIEVTNDPMRFKSTREAGNADSAVFWGKDFLLVNVDDGDVPVSIDLKPGFYNAAQLATEVQRSINDAYGDDTKLQVRSNVDDKLNIDFYTLNTGDGTLKGLTSAVEVDLLQKSYVSDQIGVDTTGSSPDFTREQFLAHAQVRIIDALNAYEKTNPNMLGAGNSKFTRGAAGQMASIYEKTEVTSFKLASQTADGAGGTQVDRHMVYSYYNKNPDLEVYQNKQTVSTGAEIKYDASNNVLTVPFPSGTDMSKYSSGEIVRLVGDFASQDAVLNGRKLTVLEVNSTVGAESIKINTTGEGFPDSAFTLTQAGTVTETTNFSEAYILSDTATDVEAFFEGADLAPTGAVDSYNNKKIVLRETSSNKHSYNHGDSDLNSVAISTASSLAATTKYMVTTLGTTDWGTAAGGSGYTPSEGSVFTTGGSGPTTLAGTGRITEVFDASIADTGGLAMADLGELTVGNGTLFAGATLQHRDSTASDTNASAAGLPKKTVGKEYIISAAGTSLDASLAVGSKYELTWNGTKFQMNGKDLPLDAKVIPAGQKLEIVTAGTGTVNALAANPATAIAANYPLKTSITVNLGLNSASALTLLDASGNVVPLNAQVIKVTEVFSDFQSEGLSYRGVSDGALKKSLDSLGLDSAGYANDTVWVDEKNPPIKISYDAVNQKFEFGVNHTAVGPGTDSNFRAFKISGASDADGTNNLGIPAADAAAQVAISSTAVTSGEPYVADGAEMQINAKRFGAVVKYNSDTKTFTFASGTTGEAIRGDKALGVDVDQSASNIQVGRYSLSSADGSVVNSTFDTSTRYMGIGDSGLMGVGASKNDVSFTAGRGLASDPAQAIGASATEPLSEIFALSASGGGNVFNVSVNGISGIIEVPGGNYVGSTLAEQLQTRINQISDQDTGAVVGGVTVQYKSDTNNFVFTTGTTGDLSTIKVKGAAKLGLDDVPLGVGAIPEITNLVQATNAAGVPLFVNAAGEVVETPPDNLVDDFYPLYVDEGELTFDKTGSIISPTNRVHYEQQSEGFSIALDVDYSQSTQLSQPFSVNNLDQDGFTSGRLDGLDIDATGLLRANYTNGENKPLGKIVMANFNNQNGLKQVGNATFVETASSGTATFGEAGAEGFGSIQSGSLERSNVDITEELVNLITAQRNFQASSKAIETSTQLTQAIIQIRS